MPGRIVIITNPAHDRATEYLRSWSDGIHKSIVNLPPSTNIYELKHSDVTKEKFTQLVDEKNPDLILFHGHGSNRLIAGFENNILIACDDNEELLNNRIIHSLTCDSGEELGPKCINIGTKTYIGYKKEFKFAHLGETTIALQFDDPIAELFLRPAFEINKALLEGETAEQAYKRSQQMYKDNIQALITSTDPNFNTVYASGLYHDMTHQVILGNKASSF